MQLLYILLASFMEDLPTALALCIVPFILGWLAALVFYKVTALRTQVQELTAANKDLSAKLDKSASDNTDLRVKITQLEADLGMKGDRIRKLENELIICEAERNNLRIEKDGKSDAKIASAPVTASVTFNNKSYAFNALDIVEGIGPKIAEVLRNAGIYAWQQLAETSTEKIREILDAAGPQFQMHDPGSWPEQAGMAARGDWQALEKFQSELLAGK
jgi:predicted flap endonuclease-1-like 5' DNA nuclease